MWQLRFDDGVTSLGFGLDAARRPLDPSLAPAEEWRGLLDRLPSVAEQLGGARLVAPEGGLQRTARLQRHLRPAAGPTWALLPHAAGFIDPLHSTGIAHTMVGIERLAGILADHWGRDSLAQALGGYADTVAAELDLIDELVEGCYRATGRFPLFRAMALAYFAAVTSWEARRIDGSLRADQGFLLAGDPALRATVQRVRSALGESLARSPDRDPELEILVTRLIEPFNHAGLGNPAARHLYRHTAPVR